MKSACTNVKHFSVELGGNAPVVVYDDADITAAEQDGAQVVCGGTISAQPVKGYFFEPTILRDVRQDMKLSCDEIFGPVLPVIRFTADDDVIAMANGTEFGLVTYVYTTNLSRGLRAAAPCQLVWQEPKFAELRRKQIPCHPKVVNQLSKQLAAGWKAALGAES